MSVALELWVPSLVWAALALYGAAGLVLLAAALIGVARSGGWPVAARWLGWTLFGLGFAAALAAWVGRWFWVEHPPLQNLYEAFLTMGMLILPLALVNRFVLRVGGRWIDPLVGVLVLVPVAFEQFSPEPQRLPPALQSFLFVPHVATYLVAYVILAKAWFLAVGRLFARAWPQQDGTLAYAPATYRVVAFGFPFLTLGLVLGAWWGKLAWDDYWHWDPKELWSLVSWLGFLMYLHVRGAWGRRYPRLASALVIAGGVFILITALWANLSELFKGLHTYA